MPEPVSNNAVTKVTTKNGSYLISFMGLGKNKTYKDVHNKVWALKIGEPTWQEKTPVPSSLNIKGRLASIATSINDKAYIFGGYTVAKDHSEISTPDVYQYDIETDTYTQLANMPVPVDDSIALPYQDRYIYLISGWHNDGNVNLVQLFDTHTNTWAQASPYLAEPVFGHAGGIVGNKMVVCDGVKVVPEKFKRRTFSAALQCRMGIIDNTNPTKIDWRLMSHPTGKARYRMAATGAEIGKNQYIVFTGGSTNPYNYNGIGYNGSPSQPSNAFWLFNLQTQSWRYVTNRSIRTMDHRGLIHHNETFLTIGGMTNEQQVLDIVVSRKLAL
ncbi:Kelch repeat-containing protein [Flocculibacter collagenilyticus]|uniref:Kelch repeat-containing protein n=1 Tax=Flocculibacter collagenilyticus TaxID=2744479 RepID=UPI001F178888|nr:kelch repeat-containing protein [Flocculibacter collagenilyticus]